MIDWFKNNKPFGILLFLVVGYFILQFIQSLSGFSLARMGSSSAAVDFAGSGPDALMMPTINNMGSSGGISGLYSKEYAPQTDSPSRMVIQESNMSLLVKNVVETRNKILEYTTANGGYMVTVSTSNPEDAPTASVSLRIPDTNLPLALDHFRSLSIKVVSENLNGRDVTDQYVDIDTRISQIERTMTRLEAILVNATEINDITNLTNQILNYQNQIDNLKGQKQSLEKNAQLAKLTLYLSTDEIALPYAPSETFRPAVIFKLAVRSLVTSLRSVATAVIWLVVYAVIWVPVSAIFMFVKKLIKDRNEKNNPRV